MADKDTKIAEEAVEWLYTVKEGGAKEHQAFAAWLQESPRHVGEFLAVSAVDNAFNGMDPGRQLDVQQIIAGSETNIVPLAPADARKPQPRRRRVMAAAAAGIALLLAGGWWAVQTDLSWENYKTGAGEQRIVELADGSTLHLNVYSHVRVKMSGTARDLRLVSGEALFTVARDAARPFLVYAGDTTIQALGTQFNVYRRARATRVSVLEGMVQVSGEDAVRLAAGQQVDVGPGGRVAQLPAIDQLDASAWRQHRLVFLEDTLEDVAAEFNRYNHTPRIRIEGQAASRKITGVFDANDPDSLLQFLQDVRELSIQKTDDEVIVR